MMAAPGFNADFVDLLRGLAREGAEFVVVGAHALAVHGIPRATGDLDVLVNPTVENSARVFSVLQSFGAPVGAHGVRPDDFAGPGTVYQIGLPPRRIDILTAITGVSFEEAFESRVVVDVAGVAVGFLGREALLRNKRAARRPKDIADLARLEEK